jgi:hypothetical protein
MNNNEPSAYGSPRLYSYSRKLLLRETRWERKANFESSSCVNLGVSGYMSLLN